MNDPVYLDYNATAPLKPAVIALMTDLLAQPGNASSAHGFGREARKNVENAREKIAALAGVENGQVVFNSGATEGNNTILKAFQGQRVLVAATEHPSVLEAAPDADLIPVASDGTIDMAAYETLLKTGPSPALVSIMFVNNETGVIQPIGKLAKLAKKYGALFHCDAVQAAGRVAIDMTRLHIDYLTLSAHKIGGPQGAGALIAGNCENGTCLDIPKFLHGGGQERRNRAGTENVPAIAGFGMAVELAMKDMDAFQKLAALRDKLESEIATIAPEAVFFGQGAERVANTSSFALPGVPTKTQLINLDLAGIAVSGGSACSSGSAKGSHVLAAMGAPEEYVTSALRVSLGWGTKPADIDRFIEVWSGMYNRVKDKVKKHA
ncbi:MAG: cysteine desulfurase [Rhodospirillales bacterium]|nr:cysteine desulfurase [Rhodospirillales bacterium]